MRRREFIGLIGATAVWPLAARAQATAKHTIGFLYPGPEAASLSRIAALTSGIRAAGVRVPDEVEILPRIANGDSSRLADMAADLVARKVDIICPVSPVAVRAARAATKTIPIVVSDLESDPVAEGFVSSVARPGGNLTGVFLDFPDFSKKWLELLKEAVPKSATIAVIWDPATGTTQLKAVEAAAPTLALKLETIEMRAVGNAETAFATAAQRGADAVLILSTPVVGANTQLFADLAKAQRLPAITLFTDFARNGGLMAYGPNLLTYFRQMGIITAKILRGAKPAEVPIETPTKFEFVLNLRTANALGLIVPPSILLRADEVIE